MSTYPSRPAAIYCRISDDPEGRRIGVDRQERSCRQLATQRGWWSVEVYVDNDVSAFSGVVRPAYRRMLEDLQLGRLAAVIAWDGDRLHRSTRELEDFIDLIETADIPVVTITSGDADFGTATGRMQARIKGTVSRYESEHKTERVTAAMASLAEAGRWKGGPRPYGYDVDRDNHGRSLRDGRLIVVPHEAAIVQEAAHRVLNGESIYRLCSDLNARGIPTTQGRRWRTQTLRRILTNPTTVGKREYHGEIVADALWPALIAEQDWIELRQRLLPNPDGPQGRVTFRVRTYLLTGGIAICGICGSNLHAQRKDSGVSAYGCMAGPDKDGCGGVSCVAARVDTLVVDAVLTRQATLFLHRDGVTATDGPHEDHGEAALLQGMSELARFFVRGDISAAAWQIAQAGMAYFHETKDDGSPASSASWPLHATAREQWEQLPLQQRREHISAVLEHVVVNPTRLRGGQFDTRRVSLRWRQADAFEGPSPDGSSASLRMQAAPDGS